ncbi:MAG: 5-(carboxyamino)imidazole ribonucleotide synthase [Bacteroidota bacterium]|nr:5-(carboxyamino)imidazole ribonucleotide synthase [Bacteroidota bacterium]
MEKKPFYSKDFKLGILGGGQLGRMLLAPCTRLGIYTRVLDDAADAPCSKAASEFHQGSFKDFDTVVAFGRDADVITIEIENVNTDALEFLEKQGKKVYPQPRVIRIIQDKGLQKMFYRDNGIPTSEFHLVESKSGLSEYKSFFPAFQKVRTAGYDGRGVYAIRSEAALANALEGPSVLEKAVDFTQEMAVIVARSESGEMAVYPPVEQVFHPEKHLLEQLVSPGHFPPEVTGKAIKLAERIASRLGIVGVLAIEMFVTADGEVLVNEMAPRPHNSGHQTIEGNITSQYEQHLRAITGLPLGSTDIINPSIMINLLGEEGFSGPVKYAGLDEVLKLSGAHVHLYGKKETRPFRKMGHVTITGPNPEELHRKATFVKNTLKVRS